jgi:hypothetical protein
MEKVDPQEDRDVLNSNPEPSNKSKEQEQEKALQTNSNDSAFDRSRKRE